MNFILRLLLNCCQHKSTSRVWTNIHKDGTRTYYVICSKCTAVIPYDWSGLGKIA